MVSLQVPAAPRPAAPAAATRDEDAQRAEVFALVGTLFREVYTPAGGLAHFCVDGRSGAPEGDKDLLPELADYLPLLAAAGHRDYVLAQGERVKARLAAGTPVANPDPGLWPWLRRSNPFYYGDLILGLLECHALGLGDWWLAAAREQLALVLRHFRRGDALAKEVAAFGLALPVAESNALIVVELLVEAQLRSLDAPLRQGGALLRQADSLLRPWLALAEGEGAVPQLRLLSPLLRLVPRFATRRHRYPLYKHNLCFLSSLSALAEATGDPALRQKATSLSERAAVFFRGPQGVFCQAVRREGGALVHERPTLKATQLAEHLCDLAVALAREDLLAEAERQCRWWLERRQPETGLIPYSTDGFATDVDSLTDFAVTLLKLFAATGRASYLQAAEDLLRALRRHHLGAYGLHRSLDARDGAVLDARVETRFTSLFLKPWLALPSAASLYRDPALLSLLRDR